MAYYGIEEASKKLGAYNSPWFDIPDGWVTDAPGIVAFRAGSAQGRGEDSELLLNGFVVSGRHQGGGWGYIHNCVCPKGVRLNRSSSHGVAYFRYKRMV